MKKKILGAACIALFAYGLSFADTVSLTLDQAVEYAMKNNRTLKSNDIDLAIKERAAKYSWNVFIPTVSVSGTMSRANEYNPSSKASGQMMSSMMGMISSLHPDIPITIPSVKDDYDEEKDRWTPVGSLNVSLNLSLSYIYKMKAAKADYEAGKITWEQSQNETIVSIKKLFYGLLLQQESLKIDKASLENKRQRMVQAETNFRNGAIPRLSLLQTQVDYQNTKPNVETAEQSLNQQLDTFAFLLGMPVGKDTIILDGSIEPTFVDVSSENLIDQYRSNSLAIKGVEANIDVLKLNLQTLNMAAWTPALALSFTSTPAYIGSDKSDWLKDIGDRDKWYDSGTLSFTLAFNVTNLLPWSTNRQQAQDLQANIDKLNLTLETVKENYKLEVRQAVDKLEQARTKIESMTRNITLAQEAYDATYRNYRNGMTELLDLRDSETSLNQAKLGLLNQKFEYISALLDLETKLNTKLTQ